MKAADLKLEELVDFSEGRLHLKERRLVLHDLHAFAQFRKDLIDMVGWEHGRRMLTRFGYFWGRADAAAMKRIFTWDNLAEWIKAGPRLHTLQGVNRTVIKTLEYDETGGRFLMELVWHNSGEAEEHLVEVGRADRPVCWMLAGYASGYCSYCLGWNVYFIEQHCHAQGQPVCAAMGKDLGSWGEDLKPHLPYFQADDIQGKVQELTLKLRKKNRELAEQRKLLGWGSAAPKALFVEVHSESYRKVLALATRVAAFDSSVLITGETGVGKEVLARFIHQQSNRSGKPFVAVNCTALPETLLESELFGHRAGSFTGATGDRLGLFEQADKGAIFLDEIGDITPAMQMKILRVLQEREIVRVGENKPRKINVRILAATNRNLTQAIAEGRFREDLYYRLRIIEIPIPPLRERREDVLPLARHIVKRLVERLRLPQLRLDATCVDYLQKYSWPGNVRELENALESAAVLSVNQTILPEYLPPHILHEINPPNRAPALGSCSLAELEWSHIEATLKRCQGNRSQAARVLGISPITLWRKIKQHNAGPLKV
jgi:two-component system, NtrC family, response regulator HydG